MLKLPTILIQQFDNLLLNKAFSDKDSAFYKKWLRFYWDFCHKYQHDVFNSDSLALFIQKLQDKNQSDQQQNQAKYAISLFFEMHKTSLGQPMLRNNCVSLQSQQSAKNIKAESDYSRYQNGRTSAVNPSLTDTGASWVFVYDQLVTEIKIRHYSPKTLKAYRVWIRQFQTFSKSKNYQNLSQQDVVAFLSFLAVEKQALLNFEWVTSFKKNSI